MARRSKAKGTRRRTKLHMIYPRAAGIDVGSTFHVVAVPPELSAEPVQTFQSFTGDLYRLANWLVEIGVTTITSASIPGPCFFTGSESPVSLRSLLPRGQ